MTAVGVVRIVLLAVAAVPALAAAAQEADTTAEGAPPVWAVSFSTNSYVFPEADEENGNFTLAIGIADHGPLHLEVRYNYEALDTVSLWAGWNLSFGDAVAFGVTPMLGFAFGDIEAIAPGLEATIEWWLLDYYLESEVVFDLGERADSFAYGWSELGLSPLEWLRVGMVGQRTRLYESERDVQYGALANVYLGPVTVGGYWFNPGADDWLAVVALGLDLEIGGSSSARRRTALLTSENFAK